MTRLLQRSAEDEKARFDDLLNFVLKISHFVKSGDLSFVSVPQRGNLPQADVNPES